MCDYFWQRMQNNQGELGDIVRASGLASEATNMDFSMFSATDQWHHQQLPAFSTMLNSAEFDDSFGNQRDLLLHELTGVQFFDHERFADGSIDLRRKEFVEKDIELDGDEIKKVCDDRSVFSRELQIEKPRTTSSEEIKPLIPGVEISSSSIEHGGSILSPRTTGIKRRKNQAKKVVCIPAPTAPSNRPTTGEIVPSDLWAWRKYGQKPIKGSPYPRGYYRCSSSKGCSARKQVERSRADPNMLVITYNSEHNHPWPTQRNALAGSTRSKSSNNRPKSPIAPKEEPAEILLPEDEVTDNDKAISTPEDNTIITEAFQTHEDFFNELTELDPDPMSLIFTKELEETKLEYDKEPKMIDPFSMFDWS